MVLLRHHQADSLANPGFASGKLQRELNKTQVFSSTGPLGVTLSSVKL